MKYALVLEGGASRTYFSCGVMDRLLKTEIYFDYVIGVSAGISFGVSYSSRQYKRNYRIMTEYQYKKEYAGVRHLFDKENRSYYNLKYVFDEIPNRLLPFDYDTFGNRKENCVAVVTNIATGKAEYIEIPKDKEFMALRASCALPLLFKPIEINGNLYMDGGIADSVPFEKAFEDGCDKALVLLTRPRGYVRGKEKATPLVKAAYKKYPEFLKSFLNLPESYNNSMKRLNELEKEGKVFIIAPKKDLGVGRTEKSPKKLKRIYEEGYRECEMVEKELKNFLEL